jgi:hypothetical protein
MSLPQEQHDSNCAATTSSNTSEAEPNNVYLVGALASGGPAAARAFATAARAFATGTHRALVVFPDPADAVQLATWHGVRLNVHMWRPTPRGFSVSTTLAEFPVMLDAETPKRAAFLWELLTARLPFREWACVTLFTDYTADEHHRQHRETQIWPEVIREHYGRRDDRRVRVVNTDASEFAAQSGLENVQDMAWDAGRRSKHARRPGAPRASGLSASGLSASGLSASGHSEEWTLDIRAKSAK